MRSYSGSGSSSESGTGSGSAFQSRAAGAAEPVVLFDGVCNLCNGAVNFVIEHDREGRVRFGSLQSSAARELLARLHRPLPDVKRDPESMLLVEGDRVYERSTAALRVLRHLGGGWPLLAGLLFIVPRPLRDAVYRWVARNRYRWFGKRESCRLPTPELRARFIDSGEGASAAGSVGAGSAAGTGAAAGTGVPRPLA